MIAPEVLDLLKKQVQTLRSMDHSEHPLSVCDVACEVAEAIETLIAAYEELDRVAGPQNLWSMIRGALKYCDNDMRAWANAIRFEEASIYEDSIARTIESYMIGDIRKQIQESEERISGRFAATPAAEKSEGSDE